MNDGWSVFPILGVYLTDLPQYEKTKSSAVAVLDQCEIRMPSQVVDQLIDNMVITEADAIDFTLYR